MKRDILNKIKDSEFLSEKRFNRSHSETIIIIEKIKTDNTIDSNLIKQIEEEDIILKIKLRTYEKCKRKTIISFIVIVVCYLLASKFVLLYYVVAIGFFVLISSFFGVQANKISPKQKDYITS